MHACVVCLLKLVGALGVSPIVSATSPLFSRRSSRSQGQVRSRAFSRRVQLQRPSQGGGVVRAQAHGQVSEEGGIVGEELRRMMKDEELEAKVKVEEHEREGGKQQSQQQQQHLTRLQRIEKQVNETRERLQLPQRKQQQRLTRLQRIQKQVDETRERLQLPQPQQQQRLTRLQRIQKQVDESRERLQMQQSQVQNLEELIDESNERLLKREKPQQQKTDDLFQSLPSNVFLPDYYEYTPEPQSQPQLQTNSHVQRVEELIDKSNERLLARQQQQQQQQQPASFLAPPDVPSVHFRYQLTPTRIASSTPRPSLPSNALSFAGGAGFVGAVMFMVWLADKGLKSVFGSDELKKDSEAKVSIEPFTFARNLPTVSRVQEKRKGGARAWDVLDVMV